MNRKEIIVAALKTKDPAKKTLYKTIAGEMDRGADTVLDVVIKLVKDNKKNKQTEDSRYELELLEEFLPKAIDLDAEFKAYIGNATSEKSIGGVMAYFKKEYAGRYNAKDLSIMARKEFIKDVPKKGV